MAGKKDTGYDEGNLSEEQYEAAQHNAWKEVKCTEECIKEDIQYSTTGSIQKELDKLADKQVAAWRKNSSIPPMTPSTATPAVMPGSSEWEKELEKQVWGHDREEVYKKSIEEGGIMKHMQIAHDHMEGESGPPISDSTWQIKFLQSDGTYTNSQVIPPELISPELQQNTDEL